VPVHLTSRESLRMFDIADIWATRTGTDVRLVSANDHVHSRGSAHYEGKALDFQSSDMDGLSAIFRQAGYRVLWRVPGHYGHVHVEEGDGRLSPHPGTPAEETRQASARHPAARGTRDTGARISSRIGG
jgi:hypothetical protein